MSFAQQPPPRKSSQFWLAWLCALCLLGFQGLGHWHRIAHAAPPTQVAAATAGDSSWGHQSGDVDCHLFDQLSQDHVLNASGACATSAQVHLSPIAPLRAGADTAVHWKRGARGPPTLHA